MKYMITVCDYFVGKTWVDYYVSNIDKHKVVLGYSATNAKIFPSENSANKWVKFLEEETSKEKSKYRVIDNTEGFPGCFTTLRSLWEGRYFFEVRKYEEI